MITLALAARMTQAAVDRAAALGALVSAAVVDQGGHLVHFQRMDKAEIAGPTLAVDKAFTAVAHRIETAELAALTAAGRRPLGAAGQRRRPVRRLRRRAPVLARRRGRRRASASAAGRPRRTSRARGPALAVFESFLSERSQPP